MQVTLATQLEAILFLQAKPVALAKLAKYVDQPVTAVQQALSELSQHCQANNRGIQLVLTSDEAQLVTAAEVHDLVTKVVHDERTGELTKPSLETLSIIAYRCPITKAELEAIRGVNCSLIIRNLLIRGLVTETFDKAKGIEVYDITPEYLQLLGVSTVRDLPEYEKLHRDIQIGERLALLEKPGDFFNAQTVVETTDQPKVEPNVNSAE